jgi:SMC interacting uncharacterized protein involved in chromosome segregation
MSKLDKAIKSIGEGVSELDKLVFDREQATDENITDIKEIVRYLNRLVSDIENNPVL